MRLGEQRLAPATSLAVHPAGASRNQVEDHPGSQAEDHQGSQAEDHQDSRAVDHPTAEMEDNLRVLAGQAACPMEEANLESQEEDHVAAGRLDLVVLEGAEDPCLEAADHPQALVHHLALEDPPCLVVAALLVLAAPCLVADTCLAAGTCRTVPSCVVVASLEVVPYQAAYLVAYPACQAYLAYQAAQESHHVFGSLQSRCGSWNLQPTRRRASQPGQQQNRPRTPRGKTARRCACSNLNGFPV